MFMIKLFSFFVAQKRKPPARVAHSIQYVYTNDASNISSIIQLVKQKTQEVIYV